MTFETKLSTALRSAHNGETQAYLTHRSAIRRTLIKILADMGSEWSMRDDEILDLAETWLKERLLRNGNALPKASPYPSLAPVEQEGA